MRHADAASGSLRSPEVPANPLRELARHALGRSGADVERIVREARQKARRAGRSLDWNDLEQALRGDRRPVPKELSWRMAVHEAGHVLAAIWSGRESEIQLISLEGVSGGFVRMRRNGLDIETEATIARSLVLVLAGRAAELVIFGDCIAGSGGAEGSDLATATATALAMETSFGFGADQPLLYRPAADNQSLLHYDRLLAEQVNTRLEAAHSGAMDLLRTNREALIHLARRLDHDRVLEGEQLRLVLAEVSAKLKTAPDGKGGAGNVPGNMTEQDPAASRPAGKTGGDVAGRQKPRSGPRP